MADANARQVGGTHYAGEYQHWDFVADTKQDYLQGCASKYVSRARKKDGQKDLEKSLHYIDKAAEGEFLNPYTGEKGMECFWRFVGSQGLTATEASAIYYIMFAQWKQARAKVQEILADMDLASGGEQSGTGA